MISTFSSLGLSRRAVIGALLGAGLASRPARAVSPAARIASLGGAVTEILWRLGAGARIAIVDTTSVYPAEALREKPNAGYLRALSAEGLLSVGPDLVIAAEGAGPPAVLDQIREAGIPMTVIADRPTAEGVLEKIRVIGHQVGLDEEADALRRTVEAGFAALTERRARIARPPCGRADGRDAGGVLCDGFLHRLLAALTDLPTRDDLDAGGRLQGRQVEAAGAAAR